VKAFNHIYAAELTTHGQAAGTKNRGRASSRETMRAKGTVGQRSISLADTVDLGPLAEGWRIQRDTPGYARGAPRKLAATSRQALGM
jgi:predicted dinucleotide-binding enzyme